jgi:hypothetical protein
VRLDQVDEEEERLRRLGPAEAPVFRLKNYYRYHFQLQTASSAALGSAATGAKPKPINKTPINNPKNGNWYFISAPFQFDETAARIMAVVNIFIYPSFNAHNHALLHRFLKSNR